jgi:hypothetical protein
MWRLVLLVALSAPALAQQRDFQPPAATEVFNLRAKCAQLAEKILENHSPGSSVSTSQVSHYEPRSNRCYVLMKSNSTWADREYLYDGRTGGELAVIETTNKGYKNGVVFDWRHTPKSLTNDGWDDANEYIDQMMAEDRK